MIILIILIIVLLLSFTYIKNIFKSETTILDDVKLKEEEPNNNGFALMLQKEDGTYEESNSSTWPTNMKFNNELSGCIDVNGNKIDNALSFNTSTNAVMVSTNKTAYCYLYFDLDNSVYAKVVSDYTNGNGVSKLSDSDKGDRDYDTYYYTGNITNNNVLYADHCWKMVITTEGNGVKMIYNGIPSNGSCDNTGNATTIGNSKFNEKSNSLAYIGYMYNKAYELKNETMGYLKGFMINYTMPKQYYFGNTFTYENGIYTLEEPVKYEWSSNYNDLVGYYTCISASNTSCNTLYYVVETSNSNMILIELKSGNNYDAYKIKLAENYTKKNDGSFSLINPIEITKVDYFKNYSNYKGYYVCSDYTLNECNDLMYMYEPLSYGGAFNIVNNNYKYGKSFTYENGTYTLTNTKEFWNWYQNNSTLDYHYTCFNESGTCERIYYLYMANNTMARGIILDEGKNINDALNEMLYTDDVNKYDSTIKKYIDEWFENNILNVKDAKGNLYSDYLQNTIFCYNRKIENFAGFNQESNISGVLYLTFINSLDCNNKNDQFTLKVEKGGKEGYGNNTLDYPVGLLLRKEADLSSVNGYLYSNDTYWLANSHGIFDTATISKVTITNDKKNAIIKGLTNEINGVRPAIALSSNVEITIGDGSVNNPYQVKLNNE